MAWGDRGVQSPLFQSYNILKFIQHRQTQAAQRNGGILYHLLYQLTLNTPTSPYYRPYPAYGE
jgi:hypothetical protein